MNNPLTGKKTLIEIKQIAVVTYKERTFKYVQVCYECSETKDIFETEEQLKTNLDMIRAVYDQFVDHDMRTINGALGAAVFVPTEKKE